MSKYEVLPYEGNKGIIYCMIDENNNVISYDFSSIGISYNAGGAAHKNVMEIM